MIFCGGASTKPASEIGVNYSAHPIGTESLEYSTLEVRFAHLWAPNSKYCTRSSSVVLCGTYVPGRQPAKKNTRERSDTPPPVDALVVTAVARGVSSPHGGDQGLPRKICSFRIDYGRCGDGEWSPPLEQQPVPPAMFGHALANIAAGMAGNN